MAPCLSAGPICSNLLSAPKCLPQAARFTAHGIAGTVPRYGRASGLEGGGGHVLKTDLDLLPSPLSLFQRTSGSPATSTFPPTAAGRQSPGWGPRGSSTRGAVLQDTGGRRSTTQVRKDDLRFTCIPPVMTAWGHSCSPGEVAVEDANNYILKREVSTLRRKGGPSDTF